MRRFIVATLLTTVLGVGVAAAASSSPLRPSYRAVYCYPTGTYWQKQIAAFPDYYAATDAVWVARFGAATRYCPA